MVQRNLIAVATIMAVCVSACGGASQEEVDSLNARVADLTVQLEERQSKLDAERVMVSEAQAVADMVPPLEVQVGELELQLSTALGELETAKAGQGDALRRVNGLTEEVASQRDRADVAESALAAMAPEMAALRDAVLRDIDDLSCAAQLGMLPTEPGAEALVNRVLDGDPTYKAAFAGFEVALAFDLDAIDAAVASCVLQERLTEPKGDGFWTVGDEIAPGRWRSTGTRDDCYWARLDKDQDILDNHYGDAGGSVTIRTSDYEVEFDDCGTWEYLGP